MSIPGAGEYIKRCAILGYKVFEEVHGRPFNVNIVGWRNIRGRPNRFDDVIALYWQDKGRWMELAWPATTRPGKWYLLNPMNSKGAAVLFPKQYLKTYALGVFKGYQALRQIENVTVYRDNNHDSAIDLNPATLETGLFGIHVHKAGFYNRLVGGSSAGCQVFQRSKDFSQFMDILSLAEMYWGSKFSYTLLEY